MPVLDILVYPDPALKRKSLSVEKLSEDVDRLLDDMAQTMRDANGVGLAAPQVGKNIRVLVIDIPSPEENKSEFYELINPEIVSSRGFQTGEEGCLSLPGFFREHKKKRACSGICP